MLKRIKYQDGGLIAFNCPACNEVHHFNSTWEVNGDRMHPTVRPSIRVRFGRDKVCHSFITNGQIQFCDDSTHDLAGITTTLPTIE